MFAHTSSQLQFICKMTILQQRVALFLQIYPTKDYMTFEDALDALASETAFRTDTPGAAAFACAGPVLDNKCVMTNLEWIIDGQSLTVKYGIRCENPACTAHDFMACNRQSLF